MLYVIQEILVQKSLSQQRGRKPERIAEKHDGCQEAAVTFTHTVAEVCHV